MPKLENWSVCVLPSNMYQAPELWTSALIGEIYGSDKFEDGDRITMSKIKELNPILNTARVGDTLYTLGKPDSKFVEYLESKGYSLNNYLIINTKNIKIKEKTYFEIDCFDFEILIEKVYGQAFEYPDNMGCINDSCKLFTVSGKELDEFERETVDKFIETGSGTYIAYSLLNDLCNKKIIKPGNYLVNVSW